MRFRRLDRTVPVMWELPLSSVSSGSSGFEVLRFQDELARALDRMGTLDRHLCIAGPPGCGQGLSARRLAAGGPVVRVLPAEFAASTAGAALDRLRAVWRSASGGVLYVAELESLYADLFAVPLLSTLRELMRTDVSVSVLLAGDTDAVARLHALNPELYMRFVHARVRPFTVEEMGELLVDALGRRGLPVAPGFAAGIVPVLRKVRSVGNLRNARLVESVAEEIRRTSLATARVAPLTPETIDVSGLRLVSTREGAGFEELDELIGLTDVKSTVRLWVANSEITARREQLGLHSAGMGQHMVFKGPAGTAKTTVARIVGRILTETGVLSSGHLVEVQRADLIGEQQDQTARRVVEVVKRALGGVLFIDEAYTLTSADGQRDAGREAVDTLLKMMEDYREEFVVVVAGYPLEMEQFLNSNPGLRSRFARTLEFPAYSPAELLEILGFLAAKRGYEIDPGIKDHLTPRLALVSQYPGFGNGRHVRNMLESAIVRQATRLTSASTDADLRRLVVADFVDPTAVGSNR